MRRYNMCLVYTVYTLWEKMKLYTNVYTIYTLMHLYTFKETYTCNCTMCFISSVTFSAKVYVMSCIYRIYVLVNLKMRRIYGIYGKEEVCFFYTWNGYDTLISSVMVYTVYTLYVCFTFFCYSWNCTILFISIVIF